jgi:prolyl oligopeptidase
MSTYPIPRRTDFVDPDTHVADSYRWLEDPESTETKEWVNAQNKVTTDYIQSSPLLAELREEIAAKVNYERFGLPTKHGDYYYHYHNSGMQNHAVLYRCTTPYTNPQVFFDPNTLSEDGTTSAGTTSFSKSGKLFGIAQHVGGSDWATIRIMDTTTLTYLPDQIEWVKFSPIAFTGDDAGLFYSRYPAPAIAVESAGKETHTNIGHTLYYHAIGTTQSEDVAIYKSDVETNSVRGHTTYDKITLVIDVNDGCKDEHKVFYMPLTGRIVPEAVVKFIDNFDASYDLVHSTATHFWFLTNLNAQMKRVVRISIADGSVLEVIPEQDCLLQNVELTNGGATLLCTYSKDVHDVVRMFSMDTNTFVGDIALPSFGSVGIYALPEDTDFYYSFTSFTVPKDIYTYSFATSTSTLVKSTTIAGFDADAYTTKQVFYASKDGTRVPMYIVQKKDITPTGVFLYFYGGFNISVDINFSSARCVMMDKLGISYASANVRGGGEYGDAWHHAGKCRNKQNVFDDVIAAGEYLVAEGYAKKDSVILSGASNGGLGTAAVCNQRPDLFRCGVARVGVMDMTRFHKFTIGHAWRTDYGDPDDAEDLKYLLTYSPLHNVPVGGDTSHCAMLLLCSDKDDRVSPLHSYKYTAELQYRLGNRKEQTEPLMLLVDTNSGHGAGKPLSKSIDESANIYAFIANVLGITA